MNVRLDPQQVPARAELLLAVELGEDAPGRPIYGKAGARRPRRRRAGGPHQGRRGADATPVTRPRRPRRPPGRRTATRCGADPSGLRACQSGARSSPEPTRLDAHGWRVYRVTPTGTVMYDEWIDDAPANGGLALTRLRAAARRSPEAALRRVLEAHGGHAAAREVADWLANEATGRPGPTKPRSRAARRRWRRSIARRRSRA